jgi:hypothetical protein
MKIEIKADSQAVQQYFDNLTKKHLPFARFMAVNRIAMEVKEETYRQMKGLFDRPRQDYTLQSLDVTKAKYADFRSKKEVSARVDVTDYKGQDKYIGHHFTGSIDRAFKKFEARLHYANILPKGMMAVPGQAMPIDSYGNPDRTVITQILRYLQAFTFVGDTQNMKEAGKKRLRGKYSRAAMGADFEMVVSQGKGRFKHLPAGIYFRYNFASGSSLKPMLMFVRRTRGYRRRVFLDEIGDQVMQQKGMAIIGEELAKAILNDKPTNKILSR